MIAYQKRDLAADADVGVAGPLPPELTGLADESLANLSWTDPALGYQGFGYVSVVLPDPSPVRRVSPYEFLTRFTTAERIAIRGSTDGVVIDFMDLMNHVPEVELTAAATQQGVGYLAQLGLITADRPAVILG